jgi:hypothetical protein
MVWTDVGFYYAIEWINGNASGGGGQPVDMDIIHNLVGDVAYRMYGERKYKYLSLQVIDGVEFPLIVVGLSPYIVY